MLPRLLTWLIATIICCAQMALAEEASVERQAPIRVGYIEFPPYTSTDSQGQAVGELIDLIRLLAQRAGYRANFIEYPSFRLFKAMEAGQIEMAPSLLNHPVMQRYTLLSRYLIVQVKLNLYYQEKLSPWSLDDLHDSRLLLIQVLVYPGSPLTSLAKDPAWGIARSTAPNHLAAVQMMHLQRAEYLLDYQDPAEAAFSESGLPLLPHTTLLQEDFTFAYSKRSPRARQLRDDLDRTLEQLLQRGDIPQRFTGIVPYKAGDISQSP
jgi:polar amino acid transport system substrate-binding protein